MFDSVHGQTLFDVAVSRKEQRAHAVIAAVPNDQSLNAGQSKRNQPQKISAARTALCDGKDGGIGQKKTTFGVVLRLIGTM